MATPVDPIQALAMMGLTRMEAAVYLQLRALSPVGPATGYKVAKALGKDPASVYAVLEELQRRGVAYAASGPPKGFLPEDPARMIVRLEEDLKAAAEAAREALSSPAEVAVDDDAYCLATAGQVLAVAADMIRGAKHTALLDLSPPALSELGPEVRAAAARGVSLLIRIYAEPGDDARNHLAGTMCVLEPEGLMALEAMPGPILAAAVDERTHVSAYLAGDGVKQALWSRNRFLARHAHQALASTIIHTALRARMRRGDPTEALRALESDLARRACGNSDSGVNKGTI